MKWINDAMCILVLFTFFLFIAFFRYLLFVTEFTVLLNATEFHHYHLLWPLVVTYNLYLNRIYKENRTDCVS